MSCEWLQYVVVEVSCAFNTFFLCVLRAAWEADIDLTLTCSSWLMAKMWMNVSEVNKWQMLSSQGHVPYREVIKSNREKTHSSVLLFGVFFL